MTSTQIILIFLIAAWTLLTIEQWRIRRDLRRTDQWLLDVEADAGHAIITARRAEHDAATAHSKTEWLSRTTEDIHVPEHADEELPPTTDTPMNNVTPATHATVKLPDPTDTLHHGGESWTISDFPGTTRVWTERNGGNYYIDVGNPDDCEMTATLWSLDDAEATAAAILSAVRTERARLSEEARKQR